jgi:LysM repeat protein
MATAPAAEQEATPAPKSSNMGSDKSSDKGAAAEKGTGNSQSPAYKPAPAGPRRSLTQDCGKYKIKAGDTFWKLSVDRGLDLQAILDANPRVVPERLQIGQTINLPCADGNAGVLACLAGGI